jgi:predicted TIM-barrel fold metal-dependent hydrolase
VRSRFSVPVSPVLAPLSTDEYAPRPLAPRDLRARGKVLDLGARNASRLGLEELAYATDRTGLAATLRAVDHEAGGGFFAVPAVAEAEPEAADAAFSGDELVVDVQTHLVRPSRAQTPAAGALWGFLRSVDPDRWGSGVDARLLAAPAWATAVFGGSETAVALITSPPGPGPDNVVTNDDLAAARDVVDRYAGTGRVLTHTIVHPNLRPAELDAMVDWSERLQPAGWKVYTLWEPPGAARAGEGGRGWFLDDEAYGLPFLERVREVGPRIVCAHKGLSGPIANLAPAGASPRDIGPAAVAFPDITFVVYHSGFEFRADVDAGVGGDGVGGDPAGGVGRLAESLRLAGVMPGANVYAELGSTWFLVLRRPEVAAHVLGTLLRAVGEDRILWGTDSVWYGPPQFLIDAFRAFQIPERFQAEFGYPPLTADAKRKILGENATRLYGIDAERARSWRDASREWLSSAADELAARLP